MIEIHMDVRTIHLFNPEPTLAIATGRRRIS